MMSSLLFSYSFSRVSMWFWECNKSCSILLITYKSIAIKVKGSRWGTFQIINFIDFLGQIMRSRKVSEADRLEEGKLSDLGAWDGEGEAAESGGNILKQFRRNLNNYERTYHDHKHLQIGRQREPRTHHLPCTATPAQETERLLELPGVPAHQSQCQTAVLAHPLQATQNAEAKPSEIASEEQEQVREFRGVLPQQRRAQPAGPVPKKAQGIQHIQDPQVLQDERAQELDAGNHRRQPLVAGQAEQRTTLIATSPLIIYMSIDMMKIYLLLLLCLCLATSQFTTIAVVATNDIHGAALPTTLQRTDTKENYTYGGLAYMATLIETIKSQYPGHTLVLDSGDQFQGGIEASPLISSGKIMNDFFDAVEYSGSAIGNHEFDFGPEVLLPFLGSKEAPTLAANLRSQRGESEFLPKQKLSQLYEFKSGLRVGVIGLTTIFTPDTTNAFKEKKFPEYKFLQYKDVVVAEAKKLRKSGANAVLIAGHMGNDCTIGNTYGKWAYDTPQEECGVHDQATQLIDALPNGTIDGILQGHRHKFAHHFHKGVPYLGTINGGFYFNVLYLKFHRTTLIQKIIEGPIPVCERVFANFGTCEYLPKEKLRVAGELVPYRFHNRQVKAHPKVKAIFEQEWLPKMARFLEVVVQSQVYLFPQTDRENELANLITSLMHDAVPESDFVIINPGGLRTQWYPGAVLFQNFYNMFPFTNYLVSFDITGTELLQLLTVVQAGPLGFYPMFGVNQVVGIASQQHRFISATLADGSPIDPSATYRGLSIDFLLQGGDDFGQVINKSYTPRNTKKHGVIRQLLEGPLRELGVIREGSLIDPDHPRLIVVQ